MAVTFSKLGEFGRLGNQLFQIASTIGIAKHNHHDYVFPDWKYSKYFNKQLPLRNNWKAEIVKERSFDYNQIDLSTKGYDLQGYFQSEKYWAHCKEDVLEYFQFTNELKNSTHEKNKFVPFNNVAVHVRRGDYLNLSDYHTNLSMEYYEKAMSNFSNKRFIIFSDDMAFCSRYFTGDKFLFANGSEIEDLYLMSMCESHIIANSSFSWWGAYLAESKIVYAPRDWFAHKNSHINTGDLYCKNWIII